MQPNPATTWEARRRAAVLTRLTTQRLPLPPAPSRAHDWRNAVALGLAALCLALAAHLAGGTR